MTSIADDGEQMTSPAGEELSITRDQLAISIPVPATDGENP